MYQSEFDALTAQILRQITEMAGLQPELDAAQTAINAAKTAVDGAQKAIDDATHAKKPLDDALAITTSNAQPLLDRANILQSGIDSCKDALRADSVVTPDPVEMPSVPREITMVQANEQMIRDGLMHLVTEAVDSITGIEGEVARMKLRTSTTVHRDSALVVAIAKIAGKDDAWLDAFFVAAAAR